MNRWGQLLAHLKSVQLTPTEKSAIRHVLIETIGPVPAKRPRGWTQRWWRRRSHTEMPAGTKVWPAFALASALVVFTGGSLAWAAEGCLPGQLLYPYKVSVNESIRHAGAWSGESRHRYALDQFERRVEELEMLAGQKDLTTERVKLVEPRLLISLENVQQHIQTLSAQGDSAAAVSLSTRLVATVQIHQEILSATSSGEQHIIRATVNAHTHIISHVSATQGATQSTNDEAALKDMAFSRVTSVQQSIQKVQADLIEKASEVSPEAAGEIQARIQAATTTLEQGRQQLNQAKYIEAMLKLNDAERYAQEARVLLSVRWRLKSDLKITLPDPPAPPPTPAMPVHENSSDSVHLNISTNVNVSTDVSVHVSGPNVNVSIPPIQVPDAHELTNDILKNVNASLNLSLRTR